MFETEANAFYIEDNWNVTPNLLLNLGVRWDSFDNRTPAGDSFIKIDDMVSPRVGFSWDIKGDGSTKLYGNVGRYYLPVTNNINVHLRRRPDRRAHLLRPATAGASRPTRSPARRTWPRSSAPRSGRWTTA